MGPWAKAPAWEPDDLSSVPMHAVTHAQVTEITKKGLFICFFFFGFLIRKEINRFSHSLITSSRLALLAVKKPRPRVLSLNTNIQRKGIPKFESGTEERRH